MKAPSAVAKRPSRNVVNEELLELSLGDDPMLGDDRKQAMVEIRERGDPVGPSPSSAP